MEGGRGDGVSVRGEPNGRVPRRRRARDATAVPVRERVARWATSRSDSTQQHGSSDCLKVVLKSKKKVKKSPRLGFEARKKKRRRRGTGEWFAGPQRGRCACIYAVRKTSYTRANPGRSRSVKQGAIEEENMKVRPVTCHAAVHTNVELNSGARG